jgi:hypothetical protein
VPLIGGSGSGGIRRAAPGQGDEQSYYGCALPAPDGGWEPLASEHAPYSVRRLTPVECSRLQSFPDDWVHTHDDPPFDDPCPRCSDGRRCAALGDANTVTVIEWIGKRLLLAHFKKGCI